MRSPEITYDLRYREVETATWTIVEDIEALTYTTTGLDPSTNYEAQIKAKNDMGESLWSPSGLGNTAEHVTYDFRYRKVGDTSWDYY